MAKNIRAHRYPYDHTLRANHFSYRISSQHNRFKLECILSINRQHLCGTFDISIEKGIFKERKGVTFYSNFVFVQKLFNGTLYSRKYSFFVFNNISKWNGYSFELSEHN